MSDENLESAKSITCIYAASKYKKEHNNFESAKSYMEDTKEELASLIILLKASYTSRTRIIVTSQNYDT